MNNTSASNADERGRPRRTAMLRGAATRALAAAAGLAIAAGACGQDRAAPVGDPVDGDSAHTGPWNVGAGAGVALVPTYEGSDRSRAIPIPFVLAVYDDMLALGVDGANIYWHVAGMRAGAGLTYDPGRKDHRAGGIVESGDERLHGMGDVGAAPGLKLFAARDMGSLGVSAVVTRFAGSDNRGLLAGAGVSLPWRVSGALTVTAHGNATWADRAYLQTFFGVTAVQAAGSGFRQFTPTSGWKDAAVGVRADYRFAPHWFFSADVGIKRLEGDAANSPLTTAKSAGTLTTVLGYRF